MSGEFNEPIVRWLNDQAEQGIFLTDTAFRIRSWNRWMEERSGLTAAQVVSRELFDTFPELRERHLDDFYRGALQGQTQIVSNRLHHYLLRMPAQVDFHRAVMQQSAQIAPLLSDGRVVGTITVIEDVTERVEYEEELRGARDEAEAATS